MQERAKADAAEKRPVPRVVLTGFGANLKANWFVVVVILSGVALIGMFFV